MKNVLAPDTKQWCRLLQLSLVAVPAKTHRWCVPEALFNPEARKQRQKWSLGSEIRARTRAEEKEEKERRKRCAIHGRK